MSLNEDSKTDTKTPAIASRIRARNFVQLTRDSFMPLKNGTDARVDMLSRMLALVKSREDHALSLFHDTDSRIAELRKTIDAIRNDVLETNAWIERRMKAKAEADALAGSLKKFCHEYRDEFVSVVEEVAEAASDSPDGEMTKNAYAAMAELRLFAGDLDRRVCDVRKKHATIEASLPAMEHGLAMLCAVARAKDHIRALSGERPDRLVPGLRDLRRELSEADARMDTEEVSGAVRTLIGVLSASKETRAEVESLSTEERCKLVTDEWYIDAASIKETINALRKVI